MVSALLLMAADPLGLGLGIVMIAGGIGNFVARGEVAERLAGYYAGQRGPSWAPAIFRKRFGIRETRIIALLITALLSSVGCWFTVAALV